MSKSAYQLNRDVEALIDRKGTNPDAYSSDEKAMLTRYSGYGGLDQYLDESNPGILYEFFTPIKIVRKMWGLALHHGFTGGSVLEPAAGNGVFLSQAPDRQELDRDAVFTAIEPQRHSHAILEILYPQTFAKNRYLNSFSSMRAAMIRFVVKSRPLMTWSLVTLPTEVCGEVLVGAIWPWASSSIPKPRPMMNTSLSAGWMC